MENRGCFQSRYVLTFWIFTTVTVLYTHRVGLNVALVAMVNRTASASDLNLTALECPAPEPPPPVNGTDPRPVAISTQGEYDWSPSVQGIIMGAFYHGYICSLLLGSPVVARLGARRVFVSTVLVSSVLTLGIPWLAPLGVALLSAARVGAGVAQGLTYTAMYTLVGRWAPPRQRASLLAIVMTGNQIGTILGMTATGYLCDFAGGWPSSFIVLGGLGILCCVADFFTIYDSPATHPRISDTELRFLSAQLPHFCKEKRVKTPWRAILTSKPVWAVAAAKMSWTWGYYTILTKLPMYLHVVLHFPIQENGFINALVYTTESITGILAGYLADLLMKKKLGSPTVIRRVFETIGLLGPAVCLAVIPALGCDSLPVVVVLALSMGTLGMIHGGDMPNVVELAPDHAGTLFGLTNGLACINGVLAPLVSGIFLDNAEGSLQQWSCVLYLAAGVFLLGIVLYNIFSSSKLQPWAGPGVKASPDKIASIDTISSVVKPVEKSSPEKFIERF